MADISFINLNGTNNNIKDVDGAKHTLGTAVNLSSTVYTAPSDGYVRARSGNAVGNASGINIDNENLILTETALDGYPETASLFVRKGTQLTATITGDTSFAVFYPLI